VSVDELVLSLQRMVDRVVRRLRRGAAPERTQARLLIVQIDGLSRLALAKALASGHMPFLARLLDRHGYRLSAMSVGLPTSTPAFQLAAMYGVRPDIPGFHYYDRVGRRDVHFPRVGHAAWVETTQAAGRRGILQGGSAYGCVFAGGADNSLFSFATLTRPTGRGLVVALAGFVVFAWVVVKSLMRTAVELLRAILRLIADPVGQRKGWRWLTMQIGLSVLGARLLHVRRGPGRLRRHAGRVRELSRLRRRRSRVRSREPSGRAHPAPRGPCHRPHLARHAACSRA
jgi:hypothetical protein